MARLTKKTVGTIKNRVEHGWTWKRLEEAYRWSSWTIETYIRHNLGLDKEEADKLIDEITQNELRAQECRELAEKYGERRRQAESERDEIISIKREIRRLEAELQEKEARHKETLEELNALAIKLGLNTD